VVATEFVGTSITSSSRPQERTLAQMENNPHMLYGRSDKRGFMLLDVTPGAATARFMGLDDVRDARSTLAQLAAFSVGAGTPRIRR
jgi:alkaline phosphatase D